MQARSPKTPSSPKTALHGIIRELVQELGAISVADYMRLVLDQSEHGYYRTKDPFGRAGDFVTAPEISQVFGELLGLWLATAWQEAGKPAPFRLVELGPGRGQLMADLVRATANVPDFLCSADIHLVESSERLRRIQRGRLPDLDMTWHDRLEDVPPGPLFLLGNEFVDALPVHQLVRTEAGWAERLINVTEDGGLAFTSGVAPSALVELVNGAADAEPGQIAEVSPARDALASAIGARLSREGGVAILVDYGAWVERPTGDTLQAVRKHQATDPLTAPGDADLTTQVDFFNFGRAAASTGAKVFGPVPQGTFLRVLGIEARIASLLGTADEEQSQALRSALYRLTDAGAMGEVFKVLAMTSKDGPLPPGFHHATL
ncbi:MAG: class I SAM-dependent methyltransferase [Geminicoccaceae bacterium]